MLLRSSVIKWCESKFLVRIVFECGSMRYVVANLKMKLVSKEENSGYLAALTDALKGWKERDKHCHYSARHFRS